MKQILFFFLVVTEIATTEATTTRLPTTSVQPSTSTVETTTVDCSKAPTCTSFGKMAHPCDCKKYYMCIGAGSLYYPVERVCDGDLVFSSTWQVCTSAENVPECYHPETTSPTTTLLYNITTAATSGKMLLKPPGIKTIP